MKHDGFGTGLIGCIIFCCILSCLNGILGIISAIFVLCFYLYISLAKEVETNQQEIKKELEEESFEKNRWCTIQSSDLRFLSFELFEFFSKQKPGNKKYSCQEYNIAANYIVHEYKRELFKNMVWELHKKNANLDKIEICKIVINYLSELYWEEVASNNDEIIVCRKK